MYASRRCGFQGIVCQKLRIIIIMWQRYQGEPSQRRFKLF